MSKPRPPLPAGVVAGLLDPKEREWVKEVLCRARAVCSENGVVNLALARGYATVCNLYRLVDQLRAESAAWREKCERLEAFAQVNLEIATETLQAEDEINRVRAENERLRELLAEGQGGVEG